MTSPDEIWAAVESWSPEIVYTPDPHGATDNAGRKFDGVNRVIKSWTTPFDAPHMAAWLAKKWGKQTEEEYLAEWDRRRQLGIDFSTAMEQAWRGEAFDPLFALHVQESLSYIRDRFPIDSVYPEKMLWHTAARVWGFADVVVFDGPFAHVFDYKLVKEIRKSGFNGLKMKPPFERFPDANHSHYTLQLSFYMYLLELQGYEPGELAILHLSEEGFLKHIPVTYEKEAVEQMLYLRIQDLS